MPADPVRDAAIDVLLNVIEHGAFLDLALDRKIRRRAPSDRGRRFMTQLVYGTTRHLRLCDHVLKPLLHTPLQKLPPAIRMVLRMGVYQALFLNQVPFPVMVHTSVDLAKKRGHAGTARLANAVLKRVPKSLDDVRWPDPKKDRPRHLAVRYSLPDWLAARWLEEYGDAEAERLCAAACEEPVAAIRVNTLRTTVERLTRQLDQRGVTATPCPPVREALLLDKTAGLARAKIFGEGAFVYQDPASMLPAHLLEPGAGDRVLDLCAAPGTKTTHIAQLAGNEAAIVAADVQSGRLALVREAAERTGAQGVRAVAADGRQAPFRAGFDRVLVDAPCSGLGTLRRNPDIKWRLQAGAPARLGERQRALLRSAVGLCENSGLLVYSVCTFTREETTDVVGPIIESGDVELEDGPDWLEPWRIAQGTYRIMPHGGPMDGFFLTRLRKRS